MNTLKGMRRHLLKPIRKSNEMAIISIVSRVAQTALRLNRKYRYLSINEKFIRKYVPPGYRKEARQIAKFADVTGIGGLIYNSLDWYLSGLQKKVYPSGQNRQTRNYMVGPGYRRKQYHNKEYCPRRPNSRRRY